MKLILEKYFYSSYEAGGEGELPAKSAVWFSL